jgi:3-carboxy-cis,cis-muconate cycloisomerase
MIHARMASTAEMLACFSDEALVAAALRFERELAAAAAEHGLISAAAAAAIAQACARFDGTGLDEAAAHAGTLAIPVVARLRAALVEAGHAEHAAAVHLGATSQDLADTALVLQAERGVALIARDCGTLVAALVGAAREHARTPAIGRTLLQPARPITAGVRFAHWAAGIDEAARAVARAAAAARRVQLGGAVGTASELGDGGAVAASVRRRLAERLGLADAPAWHGRRGAIAGLGATLAILVGATAKMARDVSLLMQAELGEVVEPRTPGRGGSSAMAHKHNPTGCQVALAAASRAPQLAATLIGAMPGELERGLGGWQSEAPALAELFALTHGAVVAMRQVAEGMEVHAPRAVASREEVEAAVRTVEELLATLG